MLALVVVGAGLGLGSAKDFAASRRNLEALLHILTLEANTGNLEQSLQQYCRSVVCCLSDQGILTALCEVSVCVCVDRGQGPGSWRGEDI